jgi:integrase
LCTCPRRNHAKCPHAWYFNFKPRGGAAWRFSLDAEIGKRLATKEAAEIEADRIRGEIRAGTFERAADRRVREAEERRLKALAVPTTADAITLEAFGHKFIDNKLKASGKKTWRNDVGMVRKLAAFILMDGTRLGAKPLGAVTEDDVEVFYAGLRSKGLAASTLNQYIQVVKASFKWAVRKGYLTRNPITEDSMLRRGKVAQRMRRLVPDVLNRDGNLLEPGEERRLLAVASPSLQRLIIGALETGCRRGELLSLLWADVDIRAGYLRIRAAKAKDGEDRVLPISARLASVLEMAKLDPAGKEYKPEHFVFGECGRRVKCTNKAWDTAVLKAHGHTPTWSHGSLSLESRTAFERIDLHYHDLRHEAGSRWLEAGWPLHKVRDMLGHARIDQTDTYLNASKTGLLDEMRRFDGMRCNPVAKEAGIAQPTDCNVHVEVGKTATVN